MTEVTCPTCGGSGFVADPASVTADDRTLDDRDQTANDQDQTWSDRDQTASDRDQRSADEDQEASDEVFEAGSDPVVHDRTATARERSRGDRHAVSELRDETSAVRLETADERDRYAELRDRGAEGRDRLAELHDGQADTDAARDDVLLRAERDRAGAAADRAKAADDRARAAADRKSASDQRAEAQEARAEAQHNLELAATDELTGSWARKFGLDEMAREIERARRTGAKLTLAFIDVDGLKEVNDSQGHGAGDELLQLVAKTVRVNLRPYDVLVRYGGDEFLCAMPNLTIAGAKERLGKITEELIAASAGQSITFGLAEHDPADGIDEFISRADEDLLRTRGSREAQD